MQIMAPNPIAQTCFPKMSSTKSLLRIRLMVLPVVCLQGE